MFDPICFMIGALTITFVYNFFLFLFYPKNKSALYFSLVNLFALIFNFQKISFLNISSKFIAEIFLINPIIFLLFFNSLYKNNFSQKMNKLLFISISIIIVLVLFMPNHVFFKYNEVFYKIVMTYIGFMIVYCGFSLVKAVIKKEKYSVMILIGFLLMALFCILNSFLFSTFNKRTHFGGAFGLIVFYTIVLTKKYADSYKKIEFEVNEHIAELKLVNNLLSSLVTIDSLTKLYNRRYFFKKIVQEFKRSERYQTSLSIAMLDIDNFKKINDTYGHLAGDKVLIELAKIFKESLRATDCIGRYGGEEFIVMFTETGINEALEILERMRRVINDSAFRIISDTEISITLSYGLIEHNSNYFATPDQLINFADRALYMSKNNGKNCIYVYDFNDEIFVRTTNN